jgi:hypothetical protein
LQENCAKFAQYLQVDEWKTLKNWREVLGFFFPPRLFHSKFFL